jgi:GNAT superfamily N-acetyltransferase
MSRRASVFASQALAARIEQAEAAFMVACSPDGFALPLAGGFATYAGPDSPFNKIAGVGFGGVPTPAELDSVERAYAEVGSPVQVELCALGDPEIPELLTSRGYRLVSFENVLGRDLAATAPPGPRPGIDVTADGVDLATWLGVAADAALHPDTEGLVQHESFPRQALEDAELASVRAGSQTYLARIDGAPAGAAGLRITGGIAQLTGAGTLPACRRRGVQSALLAARLADAASAGCDLAVVTTQPGSPSQANSQRAGFDLLYTRAVLLRE